MRVVAVVAASTRDIWIGIALSRRGVVEDGRVVVLGGKVGYARWDWLEVCFDGMRWRRKS